MAHFFDPAARTPKELAPGITTRTFWGDRMLLSLAELEPGSSIPPHSHPHEQAGMVLRGEVQLTIAGETHLLRAGDIYICPGDALHSARAGAGGAQLIEAFSPVREEYKFPD